MQEYNVNNKSGGRRLVVLVLVVFALVGSMALLASGRPTNTIGLTVNNNSQREIRHLYLAPGNPDNWGPDQLGQSVISPGGSYTLSNVSCDGSTINVIAEDQNGCFFYASVSCASNAAWTITSDATPDCGN